MIFYTGHKSEKYEFGTGCNISRYITDNLLDFEPVNETIVKFWLNLIFPVCIFCFFKIYFYIVSPSKYMIPTCCSPFRFADKLHV